MALILKETSAGWVLEFYKAGIGQANACAYAGIFMAEVEERAGIVKLEKRRRSSSGGEGLGLEAR